MATRQLTLTSGRARRWFDTAALVVAVSAVALLAAVAAGMLFGYRPLIDRSDSMLPAIEAGDVVVTETVHPGEVAVGEVVTFRDPSRQGDLLTHRVVEMTRAGDRYAFVTKGDANTGVERWTVEADGTIGRLALRVPNAGYAIAWLTLPAARIAFVSLAALAVAAILVKRIWT